MGTADLSAKKTIPHVNHLVDLPRLLDEVDWNELSEMERIILTHAPPNPELVTRELTADPELAKLSWEEGETLLHVAVESRETKLAQLLLKCGANVNAQDAQTGTPLHSAADFDNLELMRLLLQSGTSTDVPDGYLRTPLHYSALNGNLEAVELLLKHNASVNIQDKTGKIPLDLAASKYESRIVKLLVSQGSVSNTKKTVLFVESLQGHDE